MKKVFFIAFVLLCQLSIAQDVTQKLGDFRAVRVFDQIEVLIVKSNENRIEIKGSRAQDVEVVQKSDELKIRMKFTKLLQGEDVSVTLYCNKDLERVEASEGAYVSSEDTFKAVAFEINAKEAAHIKLNLQAGRLKSKVSSGAEVIVNGKADNHTAKVNSGGSLKAQELVTTQTEINISAGGEASVYATEFADAKTTAGGTINIYGNPEQVNKKTVIGGNINIIK
ncbi:head GIN domain-containing protein [Flavobacterium sp. MK4S-17]|jgi:hypothetical protein|uniref:head GIN domain-containing protein n=1 Tax=Flavobacterium sp. MK4S-17 TaxID=2543737 RepID=UPI00135A9F16|nr:head GIN domain-containing protein [Flavobacterium sp. MK4S-17]